MYSLLHNYESFTSYKMEHYSETNAISKKCITFGSHNNYILAAKQLIKKIEETELFDETILYTIEHLKHDEIFDKHSDFIKNNKRGYGYWLWKSYLLKKTMDQMKDGDIVLYLDSGCEINSTKKSYLQSMFELVKKDYIIGSYSWFPEKECTKMDVIVRLHMNDPIYVDTRQHQTSALLFLVCDKTRTLVKEWYEIGCDYHMIDDSPSIHKNSIYFKEHKHDQSIFSLLTKKYNLFSKTSIKSPFMLYVHNKNDTNKVMINKEFYIKDETTKHLVFTWTQHVVNLTTSKDGNYWGIGDIIRGMIRSYQLAEQYNATFHIDIQMHPISHYLKPVVHPYMEEVMLKKDNIPFIWSQDMEHYIQSTNGIICFLTNAHFNEQQHVSTNCKQFIRSIFEPTSAFQSYINSFSLPSHYVVYHYRFGDGELVTEQQSNYSSFILHLQQHLRTDVVGILLSDSTSFKDAIRKSAISITVFDTNVAHIGYHNDIQDTLFEFFVLSNASHIYTHSNYSWVSGFVKASHFIFDVPYTTF
jgi:hypothetical protein